MKDVHYDKQLENEPYLLKLARNATEVLDLEVSASRLKDEVSASWTLGSSDLGSARVLTLTISGDGQSVVGKFIPADLEKRDHVHGKMIKLWGDFLEQQSHRQIWEMTVRASEDRFLDGSEALESIIDSVTEYSEREGREPVSLKLPVRYAAALIKLGPQYWGDFYKEIRESGLRAFANETFLGMKVELVPGVDAPLEVA